MNKQILIHSVLMGQLNVACILDTKLAIISYIVIEHSSSVTFEAYD